MSETEEKCLPSLGEDSNPLLKLEEKRVREFLNIKVKQKQSGIWWTEKIRRLRWDRIAHAVREEVRQFYLDPEISRQVPDKSAAIKIKQDGKTEVMPRHNMSCFLSEAYELF